MHDSTITEPVPSTSAAQIQLEEGKKIAGCYILRKELTRAGGNPVWLASDEVLGKDVTLHFVPQAIVGDTRAMSELRAEVKKNRQLIHPNILRVYDFVEDGNCAAISMDRFEGESLAEVLQRKGRLDPDDIRPLLPQLAETLADAHRIQLFHRDLAPSNFFIRPAGGVLAANFGLSRVMVNALERGGLAKGDDIHMAYLSPQQLDGERPAATDDVYGFGVLLYELLAGRPPFSGEDIFQKIRREEPHPISEARSGGTPLPGAWEKAIAACLAKAPEQRPRNLAEVLAIMGRDIGPAAARPAGQAAPAASATPVIPLAPEIRPLDRAKIADEPSLRPAAAESPASGADRPSRDVPHSGPNGEALSAAREATPEKPPAEVSNSLDRPDGPPPAPSTPARKPPFKSALPSNFPDLDRPRSKAPLVWLLLAATVIGGGIYIKNMSDDPLDDGSVTRREIADPPLVQPETPPKPPGTDGSGTTVPPSIPDPRPVPQDPGTTAATDPSKPVEKPPVAVVPPKPPRGPLFTQETPVKPTENPADTLPNPLEPKTADPSAPVAAAILLPELPPLPPKFVPSATPTLAEMNQARKEREAAIEQIRRVAADAEAARVESIRRRDLAKVEQDKLKKKLETRTRELSSVIGGAESLEKERKKLEDSVTKVQAAAAEAARKAEDAKRTYDEFVAKGGEKLQARQVAEAELRGTAAELTARGKEVADLGQLTTKASALRQQIELAEQQLAADLQKVAASVEQSRKSEMDAARKANQEKITELEKQIQDLNAQLVRYNQALGPLKELGEVGKEAAKKIEGKVTETNAQIGTLREEIKKLSGGEPAKPDSAAVVSPVELVQPAPMTVPADSGSANSLGMKFVPVGDVQFATHLVRRKDFEAFATATHFKSEAWRNPGFPQDADHPVVNVSWRDAEAFCKWLTEKEKKSGALKAGELYRLPTDLEWSKAVGLGPETGATPEARDMGVQDVYPWGTRWPPPAGAGNYAGVETKSDVAIPNYDDGFPYTSPVGSFKPNALGLYDMGGNVWQWVSDYWNSENREKTLRGGSWYNGAIPLSLMSSCRVPSDTINDSYGIRIVKATESRKGGKK